MTFFHGDLFMILLWLTGGVPIVPENRADC